MRMLHASLVVALAVALTGVCGEDLVDAVGKPADCAGEIDLIILVDGSYSVTAANFRLVKKWIKDLAQGFKINTGNVQIGVVQYSYWYSNRPMWRQRYIKTEIQLGEFTDLEKFNAAVDKIKYQGYRTFTAHAINKTVDYDFRGRRNRYPRAQRAIILLTDGKATDATDLPLAIRHAEQDRGVVLFAVGVGDYSIHELRLVTHGDPNRIFELRNFDELASIVYELPLTLQTSCDCDVRGSLSNDCDPCTRQCVCKPNVEGRRCDECTEGTYGILSGEGCQACNCNPYGTIGQNVCDQETGDCKCHSGTTGRYCDLCEEGYFGFPECETCECNGYSTSCSDLGICTECSANRSGTHCETCRNGFYLEEEECVPCLCGGHININDPEACDARTGECMKCLHGTAGPQCSQCGIFYYRDELRGCTECECNIQGTDQSSCEDGQCACDGDNGQCTCYENVIGDQCDECADGFWNLEGGEAGCEACGCHGQGSASRVCDKETGECECMPGHSGAKCERCTAGYSKGNGNDVCLSCDCNLSGTVEGSCVNGVCSCDVITGQCPCLPNVQGMRCDECPDGYWDFGGKKGCRDCGCHGHGSLSTICDKHTGECECLPEHAGNKCKTCAPGYYKASQQDQCKPCNCNLLGTNSSTCVGDTCTCDPVTGQCPCLPNVVGRACDKCDDGFWDLGAKDGCKSCTCEDEGCLSPVCNKLTGECDCLPGHTGPKCGECEVGFHRPDPAGTCQECTCNMYGTLASTCEDDICTCHNVTGQCTCLPNVSSLSCDRCLDGYWDLGSMQGCKLCGCHEQGSFSEVCEKKFGQCDCVAGHQGQHCEDCAKGYTKSIFDARCIPDSLNDEPADPKSTPPSSEVAKATTKPPTTTATTTTPTTTTTTSPQPTTRTTTTVPTTFTTTTTTPPTTMTTTTTTQTPPTTTTAPPTTTTTPPTTTTTPPTTTTTPPTTTPPTTTTTPTSTTRIPATTPPTTTRRLIPATTRRYTRIPFTPPRATTRRIYRPRPPSTFPPFTARTSQGSRRISGCNRCASWPSYCHGWMCRRRWPYHYFSPASKRCNYGYTTCQHNVESQNQGYKYGGRVGTTLAPRPRTTLKPLFGYRAYDGNTNYYVSYPRHRSRTHRQMSSQTHSSSRSRSRPLSFGLYSSLYGKKK